MVVVSPRRSGILHGHEQDHHLLGRPAAGEVSITTRHGRWASR
ncbi:MAG: hypothetical protein ACR2OB_02500 [Solirubrobacteraceae bacterium]